MTVGFAHTGAIGVKARRLETRPRTTEIRKGGRMYDEEYEDMSANPHDLWENAGEEWPDNVLGAPDPEQVKDPRDAPFEPVDTSSVE